MPTPMLLDVLIVGGGLSGLMVAHELQQQSSNLSWRLLEARSVLGGRLANSGDLDMGGAWIWPFQQPHMKRLTSQLKIPVFAQPDDPMSTRIDGGAVLYIHRLSASLDAIQLNAAVQSCTLMTNEHVVRVTTTSGETFLARRVVLAVPPRLIAKHITFDPPLSESKQSAMNACHTWMAGVTKVGLVYKDKFWDEHSSNLGLTDSPAFQVYDSSTEDSKIKALTFFTLANNTDDDNRLADQCASQIKNLWSYYRKPFCNQAMTYVDFHVKRWPKETYISEDATPSHIHPHPEPNLELSSTEWNGVLLFAGSESDMSSPGVMEGAVGAALRVVQELQEYFSSSESS